MPMEKKGSITVFLALILSLLLSLVTTGIQSVQAAAARTQILNSMDIGLYSLFGQYDRFLMKEYDLFFIDGTQGSSELNLGAVYDNLESYMKPVLRQNSQKLKLKQGGFTGYRLATDEGGEIFFRQAVTFMRDTLGTQGINLLLDRYRKKEEKIRQAEEAGRQSEDGNSLENYESEMDSAAQKSQEAASKTESGSGNENGSDAENIFGSGEESGGSGNTGGNEIVEASKPPAVTNPIPVIQRIRKMGLLDLIVPTDRGISENQVALSDLVSHRQLQEGINLPAENIHTSSATSQILYQQYLMEHLGNYRDPSDAGLKYQIEYLLGGKSSDRENLQTVAKRLLLIREGINISSLMTDAAKRSQIQALALAVASGFLIPPAAVVIEAALILCWSFAESIVDLRELFHGGKVPLVKMPADWQLSLENLPNLLQEMDSERKDAEGGMSYEDYLQVLLLSASRTDKLKRGMDMIEAEIRATKGREQFRLDCCIEAIEASVDVHANRSRTYTVTKQYSYI